MDIASQRQIKLVYEFTILPTYSYIAQSSFGLAGTGTHRNLSTIIKRILFPSLTHCRCPRQSPPPQGHPRPSR